MDACVWARQGRWRWLLVLLVVLGVVVAPGCARRPVPSEPDTPFTKTLESWDRDPQGRVTSSRDPLFHEAEAVYYKYWTEGQKVWVAGGADELPPAMEPLLTGRAHEAVLAWYQDMKRNGVHYEGTPTFDLTWWRPYVDDAVTDAVVGLESCEEVQGADAFNSEGTRVVSADGTWYSYHAFFKRGPDGLVIFEMYGDEVSACPA